MPIPNAATREFRARSARIDRQVRSILDAPKIPIAEQNTLLGELLDDHKRLTGEIEEAVAWYEDATRRLRATLAAAKGTP